MREPRPFVGTAAWSIASRYAGEFPGPGSHLERYARILNCAEINSSFYRPHRVETYERWARSVPQGFRFSAKLPKTITHERRLAGCNGLLDIFLGQVCGLGEALGVLLVQMPPSLAFDIRAAGAFFEALRRKTPAKIACEPRHRSWLDRRPEELLKDLRIARVAADPAKPEGAGERGGWQGLAYFRLHGSPRMYFSDYPPGALDDIRRRLGEANRSGAEVWCIFDNTAEGHALPNALALASRIETA